MALSVGIDIGAVSLKLAIVGDKEDKELLKKIVENSEFFEFVDEEKCKSKDLRPIIISEYIRTKGKPFQKAFEILKELVDIVPFEKIKGFRSCGTAGILLSEILDINRDNEFKAIARGVVELYPDVRTIFEMGGEKAKYILLEKDEISGKIGISDYETSGDCAAGTGSFLDQQAGRLQYKIEEVGDIAIAAPKAATIAGRCSVFAKSDMIHAQQKGYTPAEILRGLCDAVARNYKSTITKGKEIKPDVIFIGGVSKNKGVVRAMEEAFGLKDGELITTDYYAWFGAIGAALNEHDSSENKSLKNLDGLDEYIHKVFSQFPSTKPLDMENVVLLRDRIEPFTFKGKELPVKAYLGIDIGSVSTNLVVIDENGSVIKEIYLRTKSRPIEVVSSGLKEIKEDIGDKIEICGVGTTGSGRELIGVLIGADLVVDEITAHKTGASFIGEKLLGLKVDTIFEIGGQDSKFISLEDGIVVDFAMNEACAAGTGSFLEERAEELGINIKGEFSEIAFKSEAPIKLGERCTVFMEQDVNNYLQKGAKVEDVVAGLAYSIGYNYINRVVLGRKIGDVIFFQGGTAYNDSVAAAFSKILGKRIIVPPHNGVMGAVGVALLVKEKMEATGEETKFRGYDIEKINYTLREFTCKGCSNYCSIQEFRVENERVYWGDKCSDKYRKRAKVDKKPVIKDLMKIREELLFKGYEEPKGDRPVIGIPRTMYTYDRFQFWYAFFKELGFDVLLSPGTNKKITIDGYDTVVSEPCFPIKIAHGHVKYLLEKNVDYVFLPNVINVETKFKELENFMCPWGQTLPFVIKAAPFFRKYEDKFLIPTLHLKEGFEGVKRELMEFFKNHPSLKLKKKDLERALKRAYEAQNEFFEKLLEEGRRAIEILEKSGEIGIVLVGRPYNVNDPGVNMDIPRKLRDYYGVNVIPIDALWVDDVDISDINDNMFWNYGRKILAAGKIVKKYPFLHLIYITNFKCGPDSYVKHFIGEASGKPFLVLQFDGHSNDAGAMTRCEAYLDSKGVLRWWNRKKVAQTV